VTLLESIGSQAVSKLDGLTAELNGQKIDMELVKLRMSDCGAVVPLQAQHLFSILELNQKVAF